MSGNKKTRESGEDNVIKREKIPSDQVINNLTYKTFIFCLMNHMTI